MNTKTKLEKLDGVIIAESDYREYDKLLTILTKEKGKIFAYAFNVRKPNSKNIGKANVFSFATFELRFDRDRYTLENVVLKKSFFEIASDYDAACYAYYFVELVDYFTYENVDSENIYTLLYYTLQALTNAKIRLGLIRRIFELKMMEYQGEYKESSELSSKNQTLIYTWDFVLRTLPKQLYTFELSDEIYDLFDYEVSTEMKLKVNKKFKSLQSLNDK